MHNDRSPSFLDTPEYNFIKYPLDGAFQPNFHYVCYLTYPKRYRTIFDYVFDDIRKKIKNICDKNFAVYNVNKSTLRLNIIISI